MKKENVSDDDYMPDKDVDFEFDENKPHRCPHCNKSFRKKSNLYGHIKKVHKENNLIDVALQITLFPKDFVTVRTALGLVFIIL